MPARYTGRRAHQAAYGAGKGGRPLPPGVDPADAEVRRHYEAGKSGADYQELFGEPPPPVDPAGRTGRPAPKTRAPRAPKPPRGPSDPLSKAGQRATNPLGGRSASQAGESAAGFVLGAVIYALALSIVEYGAKGPGLWFKAKFLNNATSAPGSSSSSSSKPQTSSEYVAGLQGGPNAGNAFS